MELKVDFLDGGYCTHPQKMVIEGGPLKNAKFPATFLLIRHPKFGNILYDTGYSSRWDEATAKMPYKLYAKVTPVYADRGDFAKDKIKHFGLTPEQIDYIIISHFHADHSGAICDFPKAKFIYLGKAYNEVAHLTGVKALLNGFVPSSINARIFVKFFINNIIRILF